MLIAALLLAIPLTELGTGKYLDQFQGGLYENGSNIMPLDHRAAELRHIAAVQPLDRDGNPSAEGKIVLLSIGMSNTTQEFCAQGNPSPSADAYALVREIADIVRAAKTRYPNLQLVFLSSRIYAGWATTTLNPEPYAYESGFAVKWLIAAQIEQRRSARVDPAAGNLDDRAGPWIGWGPYLWDNTWPRSDFESDGTHPAQPAEQKVGRMLLEFFKQQPWFVSEPPRPRRRVALP